MHSYTPPSTKDLADLKHTLGYTGEEMAALASVAGGQQWRKYTGGAEPRDVSMPILFFMAARLALTDSELARVRDKMQAIGALIEPIGHASPIA